MTAQIWTGRKCQDGRWFVIMRRGAGRNAPASISFLFLMLLVVCRLWVLDCILHNLDGAWRRSIGSLHSFLDICEGKEVRTVKIRRELLEMRS